MRIKIFDEFVNEAEAEKKTDDKVETKDVKKVKDILDLPYDEFVKELKDGIKDPKVEAVLNMGLADGLKKDEVVKVTKTEIPVKDLEPTQSQIGLADSIKWLAENKPEGAAELIKGDTSSFDDNRILVANNKFILDGHHRWSQVYMFNPDAKIPAVNLDIPGFKDPLDLLKVVQLAIATAFKNVKTMSADSKTDIFGDKMDEKEIRRALKEDLMKGKIMQFAKDAYGKSEDEVVDLMTKNALELKKEKPEDAPKRELMPQPGVSAEDAGVKGKDAADQFVNKLKSGDINFKEPFVKKSESAVLRFDEFLNENYPDPVEVNEDGYGASPFFVAKSGDALNYFFKVDTEDKHRSLVLTIGKFAKFAQPSEAKSEYGVLALTELSEEQLDQAVVDKGKFDANENEFSVSERELNKIFEIVAMCAADYMQKNPKVGKFYNEIQATAQNIEYSKRFLSSLDKWPGGSEIWKLQEVEKGKIDIVMKA